MNELDKEYIELMDERYRLLSAYVENSLEVIARSSGAYENEALFNINEAYCNLINVNYEKSLELKEKI